MAQSDKRKGAGRPSTFTQGAADIICDRLAEGESLRSICRSEGMPPLGSVFRWLQANPKFREQYIRAREFQADALADEIVDIADDSAGDISVDEDGKETVNHELVQRSRLRVDARKWVASKMRPKVYGDKVTNEVVGKDGGPLQIERIERVIVRPSEDTDS